MPELFDKPSAKHEPATADIEPWVTAHLADLDTNHNGGIEFQELFGAISNKKFDSYDAGMIFGILTGFEVIDSQSKKNGSITPADVKALSTNWKQAPTTDTLQQLEIKMLLAGERVRDMNNTKLWGDFTNPRDAIKSDAVGQGAIGDCWFLGAVAAVADMAPELIEKMIEKLPSGQYKVTFPLAPDYPMTIDPPTPVEMALFARGGKHGCWVAVLEKAAAKLWNANSSYPQKYDIMALDGGNGGAALMLLTGVQYTRLKGDDPNVRQKLEVCAQWGLPVVAGSHFTGSDKHQDDRGVFYTHLYSVTYDPRDKQVNVRNPWGWSPGSNSEPSIEGGLRPADGVADGAFKLSVPDFQKSFPDIWVVVP